jgi:hypothetical protein
VNFFDSDGVAGKDRAEINFLASETDAATVGHDDDLVVERIIDVRQPLIGAVRSGHIGDPYLRFGPVTNGGCGGS